ncbi:hypothetical protein AB0A94_31755 [Streptomyces sp. NPDC044984]|uniref:hypothetical protein n=1 Tax=Streptomyces sp. NPDC044984 TaxID=3154335 RepID=UPI0033D75A4F
MSSARSSAELLTYARPDGTLHISEMFARTDRTRSRRLFMSSSNRPYGAGGGTARDPCRAPTSRRKSALTPPLVEEEGDPGRPDLSCSCSSSTVST